MSWCPRGLPVEFLPEQGRANQNRQFLTDPLRRFRVKSQVFVKYRSSPDTGKPLAETSSAARLLRHFGILSVRRLRSRLHLYRKHVARRCSASLRKPGVDGGDDWQHRGWFHDLGRTAGGGTDYWVSVLSCELCGEHLSVGDLESRCPRWHVQTVRPTHRDGMTSSGCWNAWGLARPVERRQAI